MIGEMCFILTSWQPIWPKSNSLGKGKTLPEINKKPSSVVKIHTGLGGNVLNQIKNSDFENNNNIKIKIKNNNKNNKNNKNIFHDI